MSAMLKIAMAVIIVVAAASGTELVDVVEVVGDVTEQAQEFASDVEVEGDETELFDVQVDDGTSDVVDVATQVFGRSSDKTDVRTASEALAFSESATKSIGSYTKTVPGILEMDDASIEPSTSDPGPAIGPASTSKPASTSQSRATTTTAAPGTTAVPTSELPTTTASERSTTAAPTTAVAPTTTTTSAAPTTTTAAPTTTTGAPTTTTVAATTTTTVAG